nr:PREDICTED: uncharacterized protein LOC105669575 [Linepithema humile]
MDMDKEKELTVSASDTENRHVGGIVPAPHGSSSCEGLTSLSAASGGCRPAIASVELLGTSITVLPVKHKPKDISLSDSEAGPSGVYGDVMVISDDEDGFNPSSVCRTEYSEEELNLSGRSSGSLKQKSKGKAKSVSATSGRKRKKRDSPLNDDEETEEDKYAVHFSVDNRRKIDEEMAGLVLEHAPQLNLKIHEMTEKIDSIRVRSSGIKGTFSGQIKVLLEVIRKTSDLLSQKATSNEDPEYWRAKYYAMEKSASDSKRKLDVLDVELKNLKKRELIKDTYNFDINNSDVPVETDGYSEIEGLVMTPSIKEKLRSSTKMSTSAYKDREVILAKGKPRPDECDLRGASESRVELDLAIIRSLDRLGDGMAQLIRETRLLREDLNSGGSRADDFRYPGPSSGIPTKKKDKVSNLKRKVPRTSAISIFIEDPDITYAEVIGLAREKISLSDLNISDTKIKRSITGGVIIEIPGENSDLKADLLLNSLHCLFKDRRGVKFRKPIKTSQIKLLGLDDSITLIEISKILAEIGACSPSSISCSPIRFVRGGLGVSYARCPISASVRILEAARISIGWTTVRVEPVDPKPLQCFRCLAAAQDNLSHLMHEYNAGVAILSEPHSIPVGDDRWVQSDDDPPLSAILWRNVSGCFLPIRPLEQNIVNALFPDDTEEHVSINPLSDFVWLEDFEVSSAELSRAFRKFRGNRRAPGPDGVLGGIIAGGAGHFMEVWRACFTACLKEGVFPTAWKTAKLVLIRKKDGNPEDPGIYRPICLLDESSKLYERIIVSRLCDHLSATGFLSDNQYGFREGRSTIDAILELKRLVCEGTSANKVVIAVSFDIKNAFNSLPWRVIRSAMASMEFPSYLCRVISDYLLNRSLVYVDSEGIVRKRGVYRGVPQGSVLGPTLWNIGYNSVLGLALPSGCNMIGYADDTILVVSGKSIGDASHRSMVASALVARRLAFLYHRTRRAIESGEEIPPGARIKWHQEAMERALRDWRATGVLMSFCTEFGKLIRLYVFIVLMLLIPLNTPFSFVALGPLIEMH